MQVPREDNLGWRASARFRDAGHCIGLQNRLDSASVDRDAHVGLALCISKWSVRNDGDVPFQILLDPFGLPEIWVQFELVELRLLAIEFHELIELLEPKVRDTDEAGSIGGPDELLHALPCFDDVEACVEVLVAVRPMDEEKVKIIKTKLVQSLLNTEVCSEMSACISVSLFCFKSLISAYRSFHNLLVTHKSDRLKPVLFNPSLIPRPTSF
jgi:hypothetical protein